MRSHVSNTLCISHVLCTYSASSCQIMQVVNLCFYDESPRYPVVSCTHNCAKYNDVRRSVPSSSLLFICECYAKCQNNNIIRKYIFLCIFFWFAFARRRSRVWIELMPFNGIIIGLCLCSDIENSQPSQQSVVVYKNARRCIYNRHSPANICGCLFRVYIYLFGRVTHTGTM